MVPHNIKNIIFDLGGVIINLDMPRTFSAFAKLAGTADIPQYTYEKQAQIFKDFEVGHISPEQFVNDMIQLLGGHVGHQQVIDAWNAMLLDIPAERLELLLHLKHKYRTFLFSNTNQLHYEGFNKILMDAHGKPTLNEYFEKTYYSHIMGLRKPDVVSFQAILNENGLVQSETLFLDDTPGHLEGAKKLGMQTQLITSVYGILEIFK